MDTLEHTKTASVNTIIGSGNKNVNFYNYNETILQENTLLKQENERLKGVIRQAICLLKLKDCIISNFLGKKDG